MIFRVPLVVGLVTNTYLRHFSIFFKTSVFNVYDSTQILMSDRNTTETSLQIIQSSSRNLIVFTSLLAAQGLSVLGVFMILQKVENNCDSGELFAGVFGRLFHFNGYMCMKGMTYVSSIRT